MLGWSHATPFLTSLLKIHALLGSVYIIMALIRKLTSSGLLVSLKSLRAVLLNSSSVPYDTGRRDTGHGDQGTVSLSKPGPS